MVAPKLPVSPPTYTPSPFGLWSVLEDRSALESDVHWRNGVRWTDLCGLGGITYDPCAVTGIPAAKRPNVRPRHYQAGPFTPFAEIACDTGLEGPGGMSPVGWSEQELQDLASRALTQSESWQVERAVWTGAAGGDAGIVYPHLAANAAVTDTNEVVTVTLQCAATTVTGSTILDAVEGLGLLESALGSCLNGRGVIHVPVVLGEMLFRSAAVRADGPKLYTASGQNLVALGAGYPGTSPDGTSTPNAVWVYGTGPVFGYRSQIESFRFPESFNRAENTAMMIAERTYVVGFSCCCLYAVLVSTGGIVTGQPIGPF